MDAIFIQAAQLGGTVFVTVSFLWYLSKRDTEAAILSKTQADSNLILAKSLQQLSDIVNRNTMELHHGSSKSVENTDAVQKNTEGLDKNTEEIKNGSNK